MADINPEELGRRIADAMLEQMRSSGSSMFSGGSSSAGTNFNNAIVGYTNSLRKSNEQRDREILVTKNLTSAKENLKSSIGSLGATIKGTDENFSAFADTIKGIGSGMSDLARTIPFVGRALGAFGDALTSTVGAILKQTDALFMAKDALAQFGTAGAYTTEEIRKFGQGAGLTVGQLTVFTNATKTLGIGLVNLGGSSTAGIKAFAELIKTTEQQRRAFLALGITNDKLIENTGFYVDLLTKSGFALKDRDKTDKSLQKSAHEYTKNLLLLAELTGGDIETQKQLQMEAQSDLEFQLHVRHRQKEIDELTKKGEDKQAAILQQRLETEKMAVSVAATYGDPKIMASVRQYISTGEMMGEASQFLATAGIDLTKFSEALGKDANEMIPFLFKELNKNILNNADTFKTALQFNRELEGPLLTSSKSMQKAISMTGTDFEKEIKKFRDRVKKDPSKEDEQRANFIESLRQFRTIIENFIAALTPGTITAIGSSLNWVAKKLGELEKEGWFDKFAEGIKYVGGKIGDFVKNLFSEEGRQKIVDDMKSGIQYLFSELARLAWQAFKDAIFNRSPGGPPPIPGTPDSAQDRIERDRAKQQLPVFGRTGTETDFQGPGAIPRPEDDWGAAFTGGGAIAGAPTLKENFDKELDRYLVFTARTGSKANFKKLDESLQQKVLAAAKEYSKATGGKKMQINSAFRTPEDQERLYEDQTGNLVAKPGFSLHERGKAIDIQDPFEAAPFLYKQGLEMPFPKSDPVHFKEKGVGDGPQPKPVADPSQSMAQNFQILANAFEGLKITMSDKLETVIGKLNATNDIQEKMLRTMQS